MINYIRKSINKVKNNAFSKAIYDLLKWPIITLIVLISTKWIPLFRELVLKQYVISAYSLIIVSLLIMTVSGLIIGKFFHNQIKAVLKLYYTDELTGLKNEKAFSEYLKLKIQEYKDKSETFSIILFDIDDFKKINTDIGYNGADHILKELGKFLYNDKRHTDETFRYHNAGDEFIVVATETNLNQAYKAAERKRKEIENFFSMDHRNFKLTVSCGLTEFKKSDDYITLTNRVSDALKEAKKKQGKNNTQYVV